MDGLYNIMKQTRKDPQIRYSLISAPVLLMFADHERIVPRWMSRRLRERFPGADEAVIANAGHVLLQEQPAECNAVLRHFLDGNLDRPPAVHHAVDRVAGPA